MKLGLFLLGSFVLVTGTGCGRTEKLLKEQSDQVCACQTSECAFKVLEGPINKQLKLMDKLGKRTLNDAEAREKSRMMSCILALKSKELDAPLASSSSSPASASSATTTAANLSLGATFTSTTGHFTVKFPYGAPEEKVTIDRKNIRWNDAKSTVGAYTATYADFKSPAAAKAYVDDFVKTMKASITDNEEITTAGIRGRELTMKISDSATMWLRMYPVDKRVYKISAGTKNDKTKAYAFLDTFTVGN